MKLKPNTKESLSYWQHRIMDVIGESLRNELASHADIFQDNGKIETGIIINYERQTLQLTLTLEINEKSIPNSPDNP